ncbi:hypothetical protein [Rossellomorea marisflavi]|uniref:hypothetical protein n=1 Tax=Rossellomorea marisflavi TaxID=189381 RepID=UPI003D2F302C
MKFKKKNGPQILGYILTNIIALMTLIFLMLKDKAPESFYLLPLLPLSFILFSGIAIRSFKYLFERLSITLIIGIYFIRLVILPLLLALSDYYIGFGDYITIISDQLVNRNMNPAIMLLVYESFVVFLVLSIEKWPSIKSMKSKLEINSFSSTTVFKLFLMLNIFILMLLLLIFPALKGYFSFFVATNNESDIIASSNLLTARNNVPGVIYWIFVMIFQLLQLLLPIIAVKFIYKKIGYKNELLGSLMSLIILLLTLVVMTPEKVTSISIALVIFMVLREIYPLINKFSSGFFLILLLSATLGLVFKSGLYRNDGSIWIFLSQTANAYFAGPLNISAGLMLNGNGLTSLFFDVLRSVPFGNFLFSNMGHTSPESFNYLIKGEGAQVTKIIPMISQGNYYLGFLLAPVLTLISVKIAIIFERKSVHTKNFLNKYIYLYATVLFSLSPGLYNLNISLANYWFILIYIIIVKLSFLKKVEVREQNYE